RAEQIGGKGEGITSCFAGNIGLWNIPQQVTRQGENRVTAGGQQLHGVGELTNGIEQKTGLLRSEGRQRAQQLLVLDLDVDRIAVNQRPDDVILVELRPLHRFVEVSGKTEQ